MHPEKHNGKLRILRAIVLALSLFGTFTAAWGVEFPYIWINDNANDGNGGYSTSNTAIGANATASGNVSTATGSGSKANGDLSTATGGSSIAQGVNSTATGFYARALGDLSTAM